MALNNSGTQDWAPECPNVKKIKNGPSDRYDTERFGRLIFAPIRKSVRLKGLSIRLRVQPINLEGLSTFYALPRKQIYSSWGLHSMRPTAIKSQHKRQCLLYSVWVCSFQPVTTFTITQFQITTRDLYLLLYRDCSFCNFCVYPVQ